jgi:ribonuclease HI
MLEEIINRGEQIYDLKLGFAKLLLTGGWYLWWERRQLTYEETVQPRLAIVFLTKNYKLAMKKDAKIRHGWKIPRESYISLNIDASFDEDNGCGSMGAIIRNGSGGMIAASNTFIPYLVDAPIAEAFALKEGLMLAQHIEGNRLIVQSDCLEIVQTTENRGFTANSAAAIYDECNIVWNRFQEISIEHLSREANKVAHQLARQAMITRTNCI